VQIDGAVVRAFEEKPLTRFVVNTGYMALGKVALDYLARGMSLAATLERLAAEGVLGGSFCPEPLVTVDSIESLAAAHMLLREHTGFWTC
jgi:hypothetical protein